jgi:hypothetical protein
MVSLGLVVGTCVGIAYLLVDTSRTSADAWWAVIPALFAVCVVGLTAGRCRLMLMLVAGGWTLLWVTTGVLSCVIPMAVRISGAESRRYAYWSAFQRAATQDSVVTSLAVCSIAIPLTWAGLNLIRFANAHHRVAGHLCRRCRYDLRAEPGSTKQILFRCPECGAESV